MKHDPKWLAYFDEVAQTSANLSKDTTKVGAVLIAGKSVLLSSFNGPPAGVADRPERFVRPRKYLFASHAEQNLIAFAARHGIRTEGKSVYVTHSPCADCAKSIIQAGISCVIIGRGITNMPIESFEAARVMFDEAGVELIEA